MDGAEAAAGLPGEAAEKNGTDASEEQEKEVIQKFRRYDKNGDGKLSFDEFRELLTSEGLSSYHPFILFSLTDKNDDGEIDYGEFVRFARTVQTPLIQASPGKPLPLRRLCTRAVGEPHYLHQLAFDSAQSAGSHLGGFFHSDDGSKFYVKFPGLPPLHDNDAYSKNIFSSLLEKPRDFFDPGDSGEGGKQSALVRRQTKSEVLVSKLYAMAGVDAAVMRLVHVEGTEEDGPVGCWSRNQDYEDINQPTMIGLPGLKEGFAADAWLANWDVVGNGAPDALNLKRTTDGRAFRLDFGGCLQYRAQGTDKSTAGCPFVADSVAEVVNLRRYNYPLQNITPADISVGVAKIAAVPDEAIRDVVNDVLGKDAAYGETTIGDILVGRKHTLQKQFPPPATMKVSSKRGVGFYTRVAETFLKGREGKDPANVLHITALGNAIPIAAAVSSKMEQEQLGTIVKVSTACQAMEKNLCGQISITIHRCSCSGS